MGAIRKNKVIFGVVLGCMVVLASLAWSHCQVPCGIYGDEARFEALAEHIATVDKSMKQIEELSAQTKPNMNQIVRWVNNKEHHANEFAEIVTYYFMAQRIKLPAEGDAKATEQYVRKLTLLHRMLVYSMKAKQGTDSANVEKLRALLAEFHEAYHGKAHKG
ncbi:MAG: superoxide dismutase [Ni] [Planctomycetota bacterium]